MKPSFWPMPSLFLTGTAAAAGIAWINAVGNLAGTVTPFIVGWTKDLTGSFAGGLYALAGFALLSALVTLVRPADRPAARRNPQRRAPPGGVAASEAAPGAETHSAQPLADRSRRCAKLAA